MKFTPGVKAMTKAEADKFAKADVEAVLMHNLYKSGEGTSACTNGVLASFIKETNGQMQVISIEKAIKLLDSGNR